MVVGVLAVALGRGLRGAARANRRHGASLAFRLSTEPHWIPEGVWGVAHVRERVVLRPIESVRKNRVGRDESTEARAVKPAHHVHDSQILIECVVAESHAT